MTVPDNLTSQERRVVRAAARQFVRYDDWHAAVLKTASDARLSGIRPPHELEECRNQRFKEQTGDEVVETLTNGDGRRWAKLACQAIALAADPKFRESCGHAATISELDAAEEVTDWVRIEVGESVEDAERSGLHRKSLVAPVGPTTNQAAESAGSPFESAAPVGTSRRSGEPE